MSIFSFLAGMFLVAIVCPFFFGFACWFKKKKWHGESWPLKLLKALSSFTSH